MRKVYYTTPEYVLLTAEQDIEKAEQVEIKNYMLHGTNTSTIKQ